MQTVSTLQVTTFTIVHLWERASKTSLHCLMILPLARSMIFVWKILTASWYKSSDVLTLVRSSFTFLSRASSMMCMIFWSGTIRITRAPYEVYSDSGTRYSFVILE
ncbi:Hypothetical_protein [Hexamita inflata]|uniref:Hypothetical_protein n=1 Tax=Hexamita inflata TaxID=28002 RepID=A0AA86NYG8_9EUKA|nr:Hypothetical protein HINF_LOCUS15155 [Hexamita inflata]